jgi:hypothetical protein
VKAVWWSATIRNHSSTAGLRARQLVVPSRELAPPLLCRKPGTAVCEVLGCRVPAAGALGGGQRRQGASDSGVGYSCLHNRCPCRTCLLPAHKRAGLKAWVRPSCYIHVAGVDCCLLPAVALGDVRLLKGPCHQP